MTAYFRICLMTVAMVLLIASGATAQEKSKKAKRAKKSAGYPPKLANATTEVYKTIGRNSGDAVKLQLYEYFPKDHKATDQRPAIVFFFGGGWQAGSPQQFEQHCEHLAARGMVAITADYRVASRHDVKVVDCIRDAKSAIRFVRKESKRLGIDPNRIAAGGGSAGGHLAAACGVIKGLDETSEDPEISSVPNALVLFNPALVLASIDGSSPINEARAGELQKRMGTEPKNVSPYHHVSAGAPATLILHGKADSTVPFRTVEAFAKAMTAAGNRCELIGYPDQQHGFFNHGRGDNKYYQQTVAEMDKFLVSLGYLSDKATLK
jgi:acetyl esterase